MCYITPHSGNFDLDRARERNRRAREADEIRRLDQESDEIERRLDRYQPVTPNYPPRGAGPRNWGAAMLAAQGAISYAVPHKNGGALYLTAQQLAENPPSYTA